MFTLGPDLSLVLPDGFLYSGQNCDNHETGDLSTKCLLIANINRLTLLLNRKVTVKQSPSFFLNMIDDPQPTEKSNICRGVVPKSCRTKSHHKTYFCYCRGIYDLRLHTNDVMHLAMYLFRYIAYVNIYTHFKTCNL